MFKKTVKFKDFDGVEQTRDFYFHISKAEFLAMASDGDAMQARINRITTAMNGVEILKEFRELIKLGVGVRSEDGQRFIKDSAAQSTLLDSPAFDELLMELATDTEASVEFVKQLLPEKMQKELREQLEKGAAISMPDPFTDSEDNRPAYQKEHRHPTGDELLKMTQPEIIAAFAWRQQNNL